VALKLRDPQGLSEIGFQFQESGPPLPGYLPVRWGTVYPRRVFAPLPLENDDRNLCGLPFGTTFQANGIPFDLPDPRASKDGRTIIVLDKDQKLVIPVGKTVQRLHFFGHVSAKPTTVKEVGARYTLRYQDGTEKTIDLVNMVDFEDILFWGFSKNARFTRNWKLHGGWDGEPFLVNTYTVSTDDKPLKEVALEDTGKGYGFMLLGVTAEVAGADASKAIKEVRFGQNDPGAARNTWQDGTEAGWADIVLSLAQGASQVFSHGSATWRMAAPNGDYDLELEMSGWGGNLGVNVIANGQLRVAAYCPTHQVAPKSPDFSEVIRFPVRVEQGRLDLTIANDAGAGTWWHPAPINGSKWALWGLKLLPASAMIATVGVPRQNRNYFWYRTRFRAPAKKEVAILKVNKAQFGTAVWLNGKPVGEHLGCFTAGYFNLTGVVQWQGENSLVVRIGAHPAAVPETAPAGTDNEKLKWAPGIYDAVSVWFADNPAIESVQVAPRVASSEVVIQTTLTNHGGDRSFTLRHKLAGAPETAEKLTLKAGETRTLARTVKLANAKLWTPETPHLYTLETSTGGDTLSTRFGMREFRFDTATKRAYLNGRPYFLRGSNITLHRFFEDPKCGRLPWDEKWVRKLLAEIPKRLSWNSFRFCIGPVPDMWLDIADEAGLLIQNEFFVWEYRNQWDTEEMARQYGEWMRDNWNHPSVAVWDASNETRSETLMQIIERVRGLDLSNRPWENGYNIPAGPDDPVEDHPYLFGRLGRGFEIPELERMTGAKTTNSPHPTGHAVIINEYGWLWLNRDGTPTELTKDVYARLV
ncbi:MAG: hypothetical protein NTU88_13310, partial [Armatimonadetes bacterium]|nr:hypothetical protein [Armatimonadota bacterium]